MTVESMWRVLKRDYLKAGAKPSVDRLLFTIIKQYVPDRVLDRIELEEAVQLSCYRWRAHHWRRHFRRAYYGEKPLLGGRAEPHRLRSKKSQRTGQAADQGPILPITLSRPQASTSHQQIVGATATELDSDDIDDTSSDDEENHCHRTQPATETGQRVPAMLQVPSKPQYHTDPDSGPKIL
jgi:hypothetical protein